MWLFLFIAIAIGVYVFVDSSQKRRSEPPETLENLVKAAYAKGDILKEQYDRMRHDYEEERDTE